MVCILTRFVKYGIIAFILCLFVRVDVTYASEVYYLHQDHLGSTTVITKDGNKVEDVRYYPYGIQRGKDLNTDVTEKGFTGQVKDSQTGLYYYNARYYNPLTAKFTQPDPVADQENRYAYVANNPINITDPTGNMMDVGDVGGSSSEPITRYQKDIPDPCEGNYYSLDCLFGTGSPLMGENYAQNEIDRLIAAGEITVPPPDDPGVALAIIALDLLTSGTLGNFVDGLICATYGPDYCLGVLVPYVPAGAPKIVGNIADDIQADIAEPLYWRKAKAAVMKDVNLVLVSPDHWNHYSQPNIEGFVDSEMIMMVAGTDWQRMNRNLHHEYLHVLYSRALPLADAANVVQSEIWVRKTMLGYPGYITGLDRYIMNFEIVSFEILTRVLGPEKTLSIYTWWPDIFPTRNQ